MSIHSAASRGLAAFLASALCLSACQFGGGATGGTPTAPSTEETTPGITATPEPRTLTVCLGEEPNTLYPYGGPNAAARSVLQAIDDGPIDRVNYEYRPVILQKLPRIADGDARLASTDVKRGDPVVDVNGTLLPLDEGVTVFPSGCRSGECAVKYDGSSPLKMDQLVATFSLIPGLLWSDGTPVTADDSVFAFEMAGDSATPGSKALIDRTQSYEAVDSTSTEWWSVPGFLDPSYATNFWTPLPKHALEQLSAADLLDAEEAARNPIGWGPYILTEWIKGDRISLTRNANYFRAAEGLPKFETLIFKFMAGADEAISALTSGTCDLLDPSVRLDGQAGLLLEMGKDGQLQALFSTSTVMEQLVFGVRPASYDDGVHAGTGDRPDLLGDKRTRQAIAQCLDRQAVVDKVLFGLSKIPNSFLPEEHPLYGDAKAYSFNAITGAELLDQVGWKDDDKNPASPRVAQNVSGVPAGTALVLNYVTTSAIQRRQVAETLAQSLGQCGIQVNVTYASPDDFYAAGPTGWLFGRHFDLAEFAMGSLGVDTPCDWYTTGQVPANSNHWVGANVSGYSSSAYDAACQSASRALPDDATRAESFDKVQGIFSEDLPAVPLYWRVNIAAARLDFCGLTLDPSPTNELANIEAFDYGEGCK